MIDTHQVKRSIARLVVNDLDVNFVVFFEDIQTVDSAAANGNFKSLRMELAILKLFLQSPDRSSKDPSCTLDHVMISGTAFKDCVPIVCRHLVQTFICDLITDFVIQVTPVQSLSSQFDSKIFQCLMDDISHIHRLEFIFHTLCHSQTIFQEMRKRTRRKTFQSCRSMRRYFSVQSFRNTRTDLVLRLS